MGMKYLLGILILWYCVLFIYKTKTGSPSVMSKDSHIRKLAKYVKPGMRVADMGCGDATALIAMVAAGAQSGEGWEIEPLVWLRAKLKLRIQNSEFRKRIKVRFGDMWGADLSVYDLVYVYQLTRYAPRFVKKCLTEMKKGSIVIANTYPLEGLKLVKRDGELLIYQI